ncbi:MAG: ferritin family protein [bacterium]
MANLFFASEILEMNVTEERNGAAFYQALSKSAKSKTLKDAAAQIAKQEKEHEERFKSMLEKLGKPSQPESYPGEYDAYVRALLEDKIFPDDKAAERMAKSAKSDLEAVNTALSTEQRTLLLLNELRKHVDPKEVSYVDATIEEEQSHLVQLTDLKKMLSS